MYNPSRRPRAGARLSLVIVVLAAATGACTAPRVGDVAAPTESVGVALNRVLEAAEREARPDGVAPRGRPEATEFARVEDPRAALTR